jgi:phosphoglycerol transferase
MKWWFSSSLPKRIDAERSEASARRRWSLIVGIAVAQSLTILLTAFVALGGTARDFRVPLMFESDALVFLEQVKSTIDNGWWWFNPRVGMPQGLDQLLWPSNTNVDQALVWVVSRVFRGAGSTINCTWLIMLTLGGLTATTCLRFLGVSRRAAFVCGTLFALTPTAIYYGIGFFSLVPYLVPVPATIAVHLARAEDWDNYWSRAGVLVGGALLLGLNYVYYPFFGCFFILLGGAIGFARSRQVRVLRTAAIWIGLISLAVAANFAPSMWAWSREGVPIAVREKLAAESEVYALKIRHLVGPLYDHSFPPFRSWTEREAAAGYPLETENTVARLGLVATLGFVGLLGLTLTGTGGGGSGAAVSAAAGRLAVGAVLLATVGGLGSIFNLLVTPDIRGYARITPFLAFFSLIAVAACLDAVRRRFPRLGSLALAATLALGLWDQSHAFRPLNTLHPANAASFRGLLRFMDVLERSAPRNAMVLQLPFIMFLNEHGNARMKVYDHFRPYVVSQHLRWSYPALSNRQLAWQEGAAKLATPDLVRFARGEGFQLILLDRYGYGDGGEAVQKMLGLVPGVRVLTQDERYIAFDIDGARPPSGAEPAFSGIGLDPLVSPGLPSCAGAAPLSNIERIGSSNRPQAGSLVVERNTDLPVSGWAVLPDTRTPGRDGELVVEGRDVELVVDGAAVAAVYGFERPDVAAAFPGGDARLSGFRGRISTAALGIGEHTLEVRLVAPDGTCFYQGPPTALTVR